MLRKDALLFLSGGAIYTSLEVAWRGYTHISMAFAGGMCVCLIDKICNGSMKKSPLLARCCAGSAIITGVEFCTGVVVNLILHLDVWNYSKLPMNILGQICIPFSFLWMFLTIPAMGLCSLFDASPRLNKPKKRIAYNLNIRV